MQPPPRSARGRFHLPPAAVPQCRTSRQQRQYLRDSLRITGCVGRETTTEAVDRRAQVVQLGVVDEDEAVVEVVGVGDREALILAIEFRNLGRGRLATILVVGERDLAVRLRKRTRRPSYRDNTPSGTA